MIRKHSYSKASINDIKAAIIHSLKHEGPSLLSIKEKEMHKTFGPDCKGRSSRAPHHPALLKAETLQETSSVRRPTPSKHFFFA